jgi:cell division septum initiation protein DivIVA
MKKKTLTEEINRIILLMESPNKWVRAAAELVELLKKIPGLAPDLINRVDDLSKAANSVEVIEILSDLARLSPKFADEILEKVYKELGPEIDSEILDIIAQSQRRLDDGIPMSEIKKSIDDRLTYIDSLVDEIEAPLLKMIKDDIVKQVDAYKPKVKPDPNSRVKKEVPDLNRLLRDIEEVTGSKISIKDAALLAQNFPFREFRASVNKEINDLIKWAGGVENKIAGLIKTAADELRSRGGMGAEIDPIIYRTIAAEIETLRTGENFAKDIVFKNLENALAIGLNNRTDAGIIMSKIKEFDALNPNAKKWWDDFRKESYIGKMFTLPRVEGTDRIAWGKWMGNFIKRTFSFLISGQLRLFEEIYKPFIRNKSISRKIMGTWFYFTVYTKVILPGIYAIFKSLWYGINRETVGDDEEDVVKGIWLKDIEEAFITYKEDSDTEIFDFLSVKGFNDKEINEVMTLIKIIYPFNFYVDDVIDAWKYVVSGKAAEGLRDQTQEVTDRVRERTGVALDSVQTAVDSLQNRVERARPELDSLLTRAISGDTTRIGSSRIPSQGPSQQNQDSPQ